MALGAHGLSSLNMTAPALRGMSLTAPNAERPYIGPNQLGVGVGLAVASITACLLRMRPVLKII